LLGSSVSALRAATPRDDLLRFVPGNTAFCLVFQDLRTHWAALQASPFAEQMRQAPLTIISLGQDDKKKLDRLEALLQQKLGLTWAQLRDDILGESVIFAFRPGPPGKPDQDQGLILIRAQNAQTLANLITQFNDSQKKENILKELQEREYRGIKYLCRVSTRDTTYYLLRGPVLVLSGQEKLFQQALEQDLALAEGAEPPLTGQLKQLGADRALLALWLNPREFDTAVNARSQTAPPAEAAAARTFATCWKSIEGLVLSLQVDRDVALVLAVRARLEQMPEPVRRFLTQAARPSDLWRLFPEDSLLAIAGRVDLAALLDTVGEFLAPESRQALHSGLNRTLGAALGRNFVKDILPNLGPDLGLCLTAPADPKKTWTPQTLLALRVAQGDPQAPADQAVLSVVQFLARGAVVAHNWQQPGQPIELTEKREISYLSGSGVFPPGVQPAFALRSGYLVLASAPDIIQRFAQPQPGNLPAPEKGTPLLRISFKAWRTYLQDCRPGLIEAMAGSKETRDEAGKRLDSLIESLQLLDRLELRQQTSKDQVVLTLSLQPSKPLKK